MDPLLKKAIERWHQEHPSYQPAPGTLVVSINDAFTYEVESVSQEKAFCFFLQDGTRVEKTFSTQELFDVHEVREIALQLALLEPDADRNN